MNMQILWYQRVILWYQRVIQSVGDVLLGRRYWRQRALRREEDLIDNPPVQAIIKDRDDYKQRAALGQFYDITWFAEAKKAHAEAEQWKQMVREFRQTLENIDSIVTEATHDSERSYGPRLNSIQGLAQDALALKKG